MAEPGSLGRAIAGRLGELTVEKIAGVGLENAAANRARIAAGKSIAALRRGPLSQGEEALVIAAGPSLYQQDVPGKLRRSGWKGTLIATESSMSWCLRQGIVPHLVVTLDPHPTRIVRWFGDPGLDEASLARDDYFARQEQDPAFRRNQLAHNRELVELIDRHGPSMRIAISSSASAAVVERVTAAGMEAFWWNPMYDDPDLPGGLTAGLVADNGLPCVNAGGNVGTACWVFAHAVLGKRRVALAGVDFGYYADTSYRNTQYYREILEIVGPDRLDEVFVRLRNPHLGTDFYTDPAYLWYRESFLEMAAEAECRTINCTGGGILFGPGIEWMDLERFLAGEA